MAKQYRKRNAATTAQETQKESKQAPPLPPVAHHCGMIRIGVDSKTTGHGIIPSRCTCEEIDTESACGVRQVADSDNQQRNADAMFAEFEARPERVENRERILAGRAALAKATGIQFHPADRNGELRFQVARFADAFAESEIAFADPERQAKLNAIVADAENILNEQFRYDVRRIQARVLERFKA